MSDKVYSAIILCLRDKVLKAFSKKMITASVWLKLENLYMTKSLTNRLYLKERLFGFKVQEGQSLDDNIDDFNKIIFDLKNIGVKMEDED